jgi:hypothetical protein
MSHISVPKAYADPNSAQTVNQGLMDLAKASASLNRLPSPEPNTFYGESLISFQSLIDCSKLTHMTEFTL